jgi:hypothetical protein
MAQIAELTAESTLKLPAEIAERFQPWDRFVVWQAGDMLYLKRIESVAVLERVAEAPQDEPLSLEDINAMVHEVRRNRS